MFFLDPSSRFEVEIDEECLKFFNLERLEIGSACGDNLSTTSCSLQSTISTNYVTDIINNEPSCSNVIKWTNEQTKLLLSLYAELSTKVGKTYNLKSKKHMWEEIVKKMAEKGHIFTCLQIQNRYKTLDRGYKDKIANNKKSGRGRASCEFER